MIGEKTLSITSMLGKMDHNTALLATVESFDFDCFQVADVLGRENTLPMIVFKIMNELPK